MGVTAPVEQVDQRGHAHQAEQRREPQLLRGEIVEESGGIPQPPAPA